MASGKNKRSLPEKTEVVSVLPDLFKGEIETSELTDEEELDVSVSRLIQLLLANAPAHVIQEELGIDSKQLKKYASRLSGKVRANTADLVDNLYIVTLARQEAMLSRFFLQGLDGNVNSAKMARLIMKDQIDLLRDLQDSAATPSSASSPTVSIENFEVTISPKSDLFHAAKMNVESSWEGLKDESSEQFTDLVSVLVEAAPSLLPDDTQELLEMALVNARSEEIDADAIPIGEDADPR